jgi:hypothetical protein
VVTLSDISNAAGTHIERDYWWGRPSRYQHYTTYHKCLQERPLRVKSWTLWRRALRMMVSNRKTFQLAKPLGAWLHPPGKL